jgi:hypothetical protein
MSMTGMRADERPLNIAGLLGVGFDARPDEKRVTRGENFLLVGGSRETHGRMVETVLTFNELVDKRGKRLEEVNARDLGEIAEELRDRL